MNTTKALLAATALSLLLHYLPHMEWIAWPLVLVSTVVHELGHGLTALALGGTFEALYINPDASGMAVHGSTGSASLNALVSAGGLLGPPFAALALFAAGRNPRAARAALLAFSLLLVVTLLLWVRNPFGWGFVAALALVLGLTGWRGSPRTAQVAVVFLAIQMTLSVFSRSDYLFMAQADTAMGMMPSDVGQIAQAWLLPYWVWGSVIALLSLGMLLLGLNIFSRALRLPSA